MKPRSQLPGNHLIMTRSQSLTRWMRKKIDGHRLLASACSTIISHALVCFKLDQMQAVCVSLVVARVTDVFQRRGIGLVSLIARLSAVEHLEENLELAKQKLIFFLFFLSISIIILPSFVKFINGSSGDALFLF